MKQNTRTLYFYTSVVTLRSMLDSKSIWLSDIRRSNDSRELLQGVTRISERLRTLLLAYEARPVRFVLPRDLQRQAPYLDASAFIAAGKEILAVLDGLLIALDVKGSSPVEDMYAAFDDRRCFALCFTAFGDRLGQWRGYGNDGKGVAIGFDRLSIARYVHKHGEDAVDGEVLRFEPVYYGALGDALGMGPSGEQRVQRFLARRFEVSHGDQLREDETAAIDKLLFLLLCDFLAAKDSNQMPKPSAITKRCEHLLPLLKQPGFYEEQEERLFVWANPEDTETGAKVAVRGDSALPLHLELPIVGTFARTSSDEIGLNTIVIGPRCEFDAKELKILLGNSGFCVDDVEIKTSTTPYVG